MDLDAGARLQADDYGVGDALVLAEDGFDVFREDVLAVGQHDHVLLAAPQVQEALSVQEALVARLVPSVLECVLRGFGGFPVAARHVGALYEDLAVVRNPDLDVRHRRADGVVAGVLLAVEADYG